MEDAMYELPPDLVLSVDDIVEEFERGLSKVRAPEVVATVDHLPKWLANEIGASKTQDIQRVPKLSVNDVHELLRAEISKRGVFLSQQEAERIVRGKDPHFKRDLVRSITKQLTGNTKSGPRGPRRKRAE